jgi:hypothetical protein
VGRTDLLLGPFEQTAPLLAESYYVGETIKVSGLGSADGDYLIVGRVPPAADGSIKLEVVRT